MGCNDKLTEDILNSCENAPKRGISGSNAVLINWEDIDRSASVVSKSTISDLVLKAGTTGYKLEWYKDLGSSNSAYAPSAEDVDGFLHNFLSRIGAFSKDTAERFSELKGGNYVVVYESKYKGALNVDAFKVLGWENGIRLAEGTQNTLESSASSLFTLSTLDGDVEPYLFNTFLETDYATSKATYDALFVTV